MKPPARISIFRIRVALALLAGVLLGLSFPQPGIAVFAWIGPGLLLFSGLGEKPKILFRLGWLGGLVHYLCSLRWLLQIPMPLYALIAWIGLSAYLALFIGAWCWVCGRMFAHLVERAGGTSEFFSPTQRRRRVFWVLSCAAAWVAIEMGITHILTGFPWNLLGASQYQFLSLIQMAQVYGVYGISFMVVWMSVTVGLAVMGARKSVRPVLTFTREMAHPTLCLLVLCWISNDRMPPVPEVPGTLRIALIQPGIPQHAIWNPNETTNRLNQLLELSRAAAKEKPDLLIWPEAALPEILGRTRASQEIITSLVRELNCWMIFGGVDFGRKTLDDGTTEERRLNAAFLVNPAGELVSRYHKRRLVVFGEYMPGVRWLPFLARLRESGGGFDIGRKPVPFHLDRPKVTAAPLICFEDVFPNLTREAVDDETDFILNLTNNGWFGEGAAQWQHATSAVLRAVENGVPLVRCTNNGLTCWIDAQGRMHAVYFPDSQNIYQAGFKVVEIPIAAEKHRRTFYNRYGDWFGWLCVAVTLGMVGFTFRRER